MKRQIRKALGSTIVTAVMLSSAPALWSAEAEKPAAPPATKEGSAISKRLNEIVNAINTKLKAGQRTEAALAEDMNAFDELIAANKNDKSKEMAQVIWMKSMLYLQVLEDTEKARAGLETLKKDFSETPQGKQADAALGQLEKTAAALAIQKSLVPGKPFPDFQVKDMNGKPLSISGYKGKVVLVDFWATWCGPCRVELPNVLATYDKHHKSGFEIIGISLDKDEAQLKQFIASNKMTWPQFFDGQGWQNELAGKYGVNSIPATYLLDAKGNIIAKDLRGEELEKAVAAALAKK